MNIGQLISCFSLPITLQAPPMVSSNWFPTNERTTATAIGLMLSHVGLAAGFLIGPAFVPYGGAHLDNRSVTNDSVARLSQLGSQFKELMYFQVFVFHNLYIS